MDRVKPLKIETPEYGTQNDQGYPTQLNPNEDYIAIKGVSFENSENHIINIDDNEISFQDPIAGLTKLSSVKKDIVLLKKDQAILALEILALKDQDYDPALSFFVDSFDDADFIDVTSQNYSINQQEGYVYVNQGGQYTLSETTQNQFNQGQFTNTESFIDVGGNGALRKQLLISGSQSILENFETNDNIFFLVKNTLWIQGFEDGTVGSWIEHLISNQWDSGIVAQAGWGYGSYVKGQYGYVLKANDWIESSVVNGTDKNNIHIKFYVNTSNLNSSDSLLVGFYNGSSWSIVESIAYNNDGYFIVSIPNNLLASNNKIAFDISNSSTLFSSSEFGNYDDIGVLIDDIELYQENEFNLELESNPYYVYDGTYSGKYNVDFSKDINKFSINLEESPVDISLYKYIRLFILKPDNGVFKYKITINDISENSWESNDLDFDSTNDWFQWEESISNISGIDLTLIDSITIEFIEVLSDAVLFDLSSPTSTNTQICMSGYDIKQTFIVDDTITVGRIEMTFKTRSYQPRVPLYVALANIFETTYATATFNGNKLSDVSSSYTSVIVEFDQPVTLYSGQVYSLLFITMEDSWSYGWEIQLTSFTNYTDGVLYVNGNDQSRDVAFKLLNASVNETVYFDNLTIESESTYKNMGTFLSQKIDLGISPDTLSKFYWNESIKNDSIRIRIKTSTTEAGLDSASWSTWYTDSSGITNNLSSINPYRWMQYEIGWYDGDEYDSSIVKSITLEYTVSGVTQAEIISKVNNVNEQPEKFILRFQDVLNSGSIAYYISRNNGLNWQFIDRSLEGTYINFLTAGLGTNIKLKAVINGNAKLYGWSLATDKEFI